VMEYCDGGTLKDLCSDVYLNKYEISHFCEESMTITICLLSGDLSFKRLKKKTQRVCLKAKITENTVCTLVRANAPHEPLSEDSKNAV